MRALILAALLAGCTISEEAVHDMEGPELLPEAPKECSEPEVVIAPGVSPLNGADWATIGRAKSRCGQLFKNSPCVKVFYKYGELRYGVLCGAKE